MADRSAAAITALEAALARTPKEVAPYEHALLAHRLGVAYAESGGRPAERLHQALAHLDRAASLLDARYHPVEHARVLTAAGSVRRAMGSPRAALDLFERARATAEARVGRDEAAAMANNVGLALLDVGQCETAVERFDEAIGAFRTDTPDGRRGRASALHNRGLARAASGRPEALEAAIADYDAAMAEVTLDEAPLHHGLARHSRGAAAAALAVATGEDGSWRSLAIESFTAALEVFTWPEHPVQHAVASFNLGRTRSRTDVTEERRRALLCFEDAVTAFDPRHQAPAWREAFDALGAVEAELAEEAPGWTRADHLIALLDSDPAQASIVVRSRLARWLPLPERARRAALNAFADAALRHGPVQGAAALVELLTAAMELPTAAQEAVLDSLIAVRTAAVEDDRRAEIDAIVDRMVGDAVVGPQRVFVRDHLVAGGFERP